MLALASKAWLRLSAACTARGLAEEDSIHIVMIGLMVMRWLAAITGLVMRPSRHWSAQGRARP